MQSGKGFAPQSGRTAAVLAAARGAPDRPRACISRPSSRASWHGAPTTSRQPARVVSHPSMAATRSRRLSCARAPGSPCHAHPSNSTSKRSAAYRRSWRPARVCCWRSPNGSPCGRSTPLTKRSSSTLSAPAAVGVSTSIRSERQRCRARPTSASRNDAGVVRWVATALTTTAIAASNGIVSARSNTVCSTAVRQGQAAGSNRCCRNRLRCNRIPGAGRTRRRWSTRRSTTCGAGPRPCRKAALRCDGAAEPKTSPSLGGLVGGAI